MKVLLLGEFSGVHKNLKEGLEQHGVEVTLAAEGDGWKKIECDIFLGSEKKGIFGKIKKIKNILRAIPKFRGYDVVQLVSPVVFPKSMGLNILIVKYLKRKNSKLFLLGAGAIYENSIVADFLEKNFKFPGLYQQTKKTLPSVWSQTSAGRRYNDWLLESVNGYIPIMYEYAEGYRLLKSNKLCRTIPIPINVDQVKYTDNEVRGKVVIFHGLNREGIKGTPLIREAMEVLEKKYPERVECVIDGRMPLNEYLEVLNKANVVIDQTYSVSAGVNALYNLAMGKVVMGGGDIECLDEMGVSESPLIAINPCVEDIVSKLEGIIFDREEVKNKGRLSRLFVEKNHDYRDIAKIYLDVWESH